jgi:hypothetical protein
MSAVASLTPGRPPLPASCAGTGGHLAAGPRNVAADATPPPFPTTTPQRCCPTRWTCSRAGCGRMAGATSSRSAGEVQRQQGDLEPAAVRGPGTAPPPPPADPPAPSRCAPPALGGARPATPDTPVGSGVPHRAGHRAQSQPRQPRLRQGSPDRSGWTPTPTCFVMRWPRPWRPTRNRRPSSPPSCAMPTGRARPAHLHPPAPPDRTPGRWADRGDLRPSGVGRASGGAKSERRPTPQPRLKGYARTAFPQLRASVAGTGFEPV